MRLQALTSVHTLENPSNGIYITVCTEEYSTHLDNHPWRNVAVQVAGELVSHFKSFAYCLPSPKTGVLLLPPPKQECRRKDKKQPTLSACTLNVETQNADWCHFGPLALRHVRHQVLPRYVHLQLAPCACHQCPRIPSPQCPGTVLALLGAHAVLPCGKLDPVAAHHVAVDHEPGAERCRPLYPQLL